MRWLDKMSNNIKKGLRNWLQVQPAQKYAISIQEVLDFELAAIRNKIWYRGDGNEIEQLYQQNSEYADRYKFWASKCTPGMEMRKIHTGLPGLMVRTLSNIVLTDMNDFEFASEVHKELWGNIAKENEFKKGLEKSLRELLYIGDGAYKISINTDISDYPILEWFPGERVEYVYRCGRIREVVFKTQYTADTKRFVLCEHYGYGYVNYKLYYEEKEVSLEVLEDTKNLKPTTFDTNILLAIPMKIYDSNKFEGRGGSIFDGKLDSFDALDEAWSQWMDALRAGRAKTYIPECLIPRDPNTGKLMQPNSFDNRYIKSESDMSQNAKNQITTEQAAIPHDGYMSTYSTALDMCIQGVLSPSTLGIDVKKLDNAEAQREKEKATLYTRNAIIEALQELLPKVIGSSINAYQILKKTTIEEVEVNIPFGEYANPSFESQVETVGKAKTQNIMSIEACVDELYGDTKDDEWKKAEVARLKAEQGIATVEEPGVNMTAGNFGVNLEGDQNAGEGSKPTLQNE